MGKHGIFVLKMTLANRLKQVRGSLSQTELSSICGVSQRTIGYYEKGERTPDIGFIKNICAELNISLNWLVFGVGSIQADALSTTADSEETADMSSIRKNNTTKLLDNKKSTPPTVGDLGLQQEINTLNRELRDLLRENGDLRVEVVELNMKVERHTSRIKELEEENARLRGSLRTPTIDTQNCKECA